MRKFRFFGFSVKSEYILLTLIVIGGIILRLEASNHLRVIGPDGVAYVSSSSNFLRGVGEFERRGPLYQGLLSLSYFVFGVSYESSVLISQLFGTIAVILIFFLGKSLFNSETGLVAALIITINPIFTNFSAWVLRETLGITLVIALILIVNYSVKINYAKKRIFLTFMSGVVAGLGVLTREEMSLVIPIACIAYFFFIKKQKRVFLLDSAVFLIGLLLVMSPWLLYSANSFGDGLYSYRFYIEGVTYDTVEGDLTGTSGEPLYIGIPKAFLLGSWRFIIEWPALFSILPLFFIPIGIIHTLKRRDLWIIYFLLIIDVVFVSYLASDPEYFDRLITGYNWSDPLRFFSSIGMPFNVIIAAGIVKTIPFITDLLTYKSHESKNHIKIKVSRNIKIWQRRFSRLFSIKTFSILGIILIILVTYVPPFIFTFDYLDQRTEQPFVQAGNYFNSIG